MSLDILDIFDSSLDKLYLDKIVSRYCKVHIDTTMKALSFILLYRRATDTSFYPVADFSRECILPYKVTLLQMGKYLLLLSYLSIIIFISMLLSL